MTFQKIDYENWDRKDIYELFDCFSYTFTVELDMTALRAYMKKTGRKFYPLIAWVITTVVNKDQDYRVAKVDGELGYFDHLDTSYTLRRGSKPHLFTHMATVYSEDLDTYYEHFIRDKALCEAEDRLYYYNPMPANLVDISITPTMTYKAMSLDIPPTFYQRDAQNVKYSPFTTVGRFFEKDGKILLPVTTNFHHEVNDGYHAEKFFRLFQETLDDFRNR